MPSLKDILGHLTFRANQADVAKKSRNIGLQAAAMFRKGPQETLEVMSKVLQMEDFLKEVTGKWTKLQDIDSGGTFDAGDIRIWIDIAQRAGVKHVPYREILSLGYDDLESVCRRLPVDPKVQSRISKGVSSFLSAFEIDEKSLSKPEKVEIDPSVVEERLFDAMDDVPEGWMVRTHLSGSSLLKTFAGAGSVGNPSEGSKLTKDVELGPGWVRIGNRRRVDATDERFLSLFVGGHDETLHFIARPWTPSNHVVSCEDPMRHGTVFAGKGLWPMEWRCFVKNNEVTGVACYYPWIGEANPENARTALKVKEMAEAMIQAALDLNLSTGFAKLDILRNPEMTNQTSMQAKIAQSYDKNAISCSLDFLETADGIVLLEGGVPWTPFGGANPCAFAGYGVEDRDFSRQRLDGVAFRCMDHVSMGEIQTWHTGDPSGAILTWDEVRELARDPSQDPQP